MSLRDNPSCRIEFGDSGPDSLGRRRFTLLWEDAGNEWIKEPSKQDGKPVGHRRAQCFFAAPEKQGFTVHGERLPQ